MSSSDRSPHSDSASDHHASDHHASDTDGCDSDTDDSDHHGHKSHKGHEGTGPQAPHADHDNPSSDQSHSDHDHDHDHDHGAHHSHGGVLKRAIMMLWGHQHDLADKVDAPLEADKRGMRALWVSLAILGLTALLQAIVVAISGSVALLGEALHNMVDALTAFPLAIAFTLAKRPATKRYTYGFGRAEDLAGLVVLLTIAISTIVAIFEALRRLGSPVAVHGLVYVALAALVGIAGNEIVAAYRIAVGKRIGSAALVADGQHARTDGLSSVAVLLGVLGVALGWRRADAIAGLVIVVPIVTVLRSAALETYRRLMDAVDPELVNKVEMVLGEVPGVLEVAAVKLRWIGHELHLEADITVDATLSVAEGHNVSELARHRLMHDVPRLFSVSIHADPLQLPGMVDPHDVLAHHAPPGWQRTRDRNSPSERGSHFL